MAKSNVGKVNMRKQYYKTWDSYQIPMKPSGPIEYADTEFLNSYYLGLLDSNNKLIKFTKYWKKSSPEGIVKLGSISSVEMKIYYKAIMTPDGKLSKGEQIEYKQTESNPYYYRGLVEQGSESIVLELIQAKVLFVDEYEYWPNGKLKQRRMIKENGDILDISYDRDGQRIR